MKSLVVNPKQNMTSLARLRSGTQRELPRSRAERKYTDLALDKEELAQEGHVVELDAEGSPRVRLERHQRRLGHLPPRDALAGPHELIPRLARRRLRPLKQQVRVARQRRRRRWRGRRGRGGAGQRVGRVVLDVGGRALGVARGGEERELVLLLLVGRGEGGLVLEEEVGEHEVVGVLRIRVGIGGVCVGVHRRSRRRLLRGGVGGRGGAIPGVVALLWPLVFAAASHLAGRFRRRGAARVVELGGGGVEAAPMS